ncbi:uroporphyrinogen-III synthase [Glutamicibacter uratoxydans]|uniref:uroporphyrinogen-III synthase n=1 Tax=Glutamicibacter uratoxydans TaxID=43667 RepID=UPI003D6F7E63
MALHAMILRAPQRATATVAALRPLGFTSTCVQLIHTVWPQDLAPLEQLVRRLQAGQYQWLVLTSVNTVQALASLLDGAQLPATTRIAAVGTKTAQVLRELLHREADFVPEVQSAAGMLAQWQLVPGTAVAYPHGDLASPTLAAGLTAWGVELDEAIAYSTVPAGTAGEPLSSEPVPAGLTVLSPQHLVAALAETDLVIFAAPSIVREFKALTGSTLPARVRTLAIGEPTARALEAAGLPVHATASDPTPAGLAARAAELFQSHPKK